MCLCVCACVCPLVCERADRSLSKHTLYSPLTKSHVLEVLEVLADERVSVCRPPATEASSGCLNAMTPLKLLHTLRQLTSPEHSPPPIGHGHQRPPPAPQAANQRAPPVAKGALLQSGVVVALRLFHLGRSPPLGQNSGHHPPLPLLIHRCTLNTYS